MKCVVVSSVFTVLAGLTTAVADNLFPGGDFSLAADSLAPHAFADGGRVSLFQEDASWNKCGRLDLPPAEQTACAIVGSDGNAAGIPVRGGVSYDFSVELRGAVGFVSVGACVCNAGFERDIRFFGTKEVSVRENEWTVCRGSFSVPAGFKRAAVCIRLKGKPGTERHVLFDNVKVEERTVGFSAKGVEVVKSIAPGDVFSDFLKFSNAVGCTGPSRYGIKARVDLEISALVVAVAVKREGGNAAGTASDPWSGDCLELHFAPPREDAARLFSQFAWNAAGATFARAGNDDRPDVAFELVDTKVENGVWESRVRIPFASLGFRQPPVRGSILPFNLGYACRGGEYASWSPVVSGFADVPHHGRFCVGTYAEALRAGWGVDEPVADRVTFERRVSEIETAARQAELDRFRAAAFTVSVVPTESDFAMPFVPREAFSPVTNIHVKAAVNERTGLPVAIFNATDSIETYVARLETSTFDPVRDWADKEYNGTWGLDGFPSERMTARVAVPVKDTDTVSVTTRLDPLPKMDEACTVRVGPHEAGLVWFDFDTAGVKPGTYRGRLRVIPLSQPSTFKETRGYGIGLYLGKMQDVPVALEVLPFELPPLPSLPSGFFQHPDDDEGRFDLMYGLGTGEFSMSPGDFAHETGPEVEKAARRVRNVREWAAARGYKPTFFIGFNCYPSFVKYIQTSKDNALRNWPDFIRRVKRQMNDWGVDDADYNVEVWDEPEPEKFEEVRRTLVEAKEAEPTVRLTLTLSAHPFPTVRMREISDLVDNWVLWSTGCFVGSDRLSFIRETIRAGKKVCHYTCSVSARNPIYDWYRLHPWYGLRHGLSGNQFFWFQEQWGGYGTVDFKNRLASGLVLSSFGSTIPTLRYMAMRNGVTDLKYLDALKATAGDVPEVKKFLAEVPVAVIETGRHDRTTADRMREKATELLLKYSVRSKER